jgi:5-(carboxyamino)imidazole ribonucleotide mutase
MPAGIPVATFAIGAAGAGNAGLYAAAILAVHDRELGKRLEQFRRSQEQRALDSRLPELS